MLRLKQLNLLYRLMISTNLLNRCRGSIFYSFSKLKYLGLIYNRKPNFLLVPFLYQISFLSKAKSEDILNKCIQLADKHYDDSKFQEADIVLTALLENDYPNNDEVIWRLARIKYELSRIEQAKEKTATSLMEESYKLVQMALEINPHNGYAHKWFAIINDLVASSKGIRDKINMALQTRDHLVEAVKYIPQDGTTYYSLGVWYYTIADFTWYERKIASTLNSKFPAATYQEALAYFQKAEEVEPSFFSSNYLFIAKCFIRLQENDKAIEFLVKARDSIQKNTNDNNAHKEALMMLQKLGVK